MFLQEPQGRALNGLCAGCLLESMQLSLSLFCLLARLAGGLGSLPSLLPLLLDGEESCLYQYLFPMKYFLVIMKNRDKNVTSQCARPHSFSF